MCSSTHFRLPTASNFFILPLIPLISELPATATAIANPFIESVTIHDDREDAPADGSVESPSESQDW
jgi:hypothetical protein